MGEERRDRSTPTHHPYALGEGMVVEDLLMGIGMGLELGGWVYEKGMVTEVQE